MTQYMEIYRMNMRFLRGAGLYLPNGINLCNLVLIVTGKQQNFSKLMQTPGVFLLITTPKTTENVCFNPFWGVNIDFTEKV